MPVRIYAGVPQNGSWEIPAILMAAAPVIATEFPLMAELGKAAASKAATAIVGCVVKMWQGGSSAKKTEVEMAFDFAAKALADSGQTNRHAIDAVVRMAEQQKSSARLLVVPVGLSCERMMVGNLANGAVAIDPNVRAAIDAPEEKDIEPTKRHEILISEMDRINATCKFAFREDQHNERRVTGEITDPIIQTANDPYSAAFSAQKWLAVSGKLQTKKGEPDRLFISDILADA